MRYLSSLVVLAALLALALSASAADWPQLHGPNGDRTSPDTGLNSDWTANPPTQAWKVVLSDGGYAGPCVVAGTVYIVDHSAGKDILRAIGLADGKEIWRLTYPMTWNGGNGETIATPTYDNGMLYIEARDGQVLCVDVAKQAIVWNVSLKKDLGGNYNQYGYCQSVTVDGGNVLVQPGGAGKACAALNKLTGKTVWMGGGDEKPGYAPVVVATLNDVKQYVCMGGNSVFGVAPDTGKQLWSIPWPGAYGGINCTTPIVVGQNSIFITTGYGKPSALYDITANGPKQVWSNKNIIARVNQPVLVNGDIYSTGEQNKLVCEDSATGKVLWSHPGFEWGGIVAVDGKLIVVDGTNGNITLVKLTPDSYQSLGTVTGLGGQSWAPPVEADGVLLVRNQKALAAYKLK